MSTVVSKTGLQIMGVLATGWGTDTAEVFGWLTCHCQSIREIECEAPKAVGLATFSPSRYAFRCFPSKKGNINIWGPLGNLCVCGIIWKCKEGGKMRSGLSTWMSCVASTATLYNPYKGCMCWCSRGWGNGLEIGIQNQAMSWWLCKLRKWVNTCFLSWWDAYLQKTDAQVYIEGLVNPQ